MTESANPSAAAPDVAAEPATLREKLAAGRFVVTAEVDPPHGLRARRALEGAALLKDAGIDAINVGDSPTAKVRMSPLAMSILLQRELGVEIVMHYTTRDRNALAVHSDMVGAHVLGIRNILCLRGDPPSAGRLHGHRRRLGHQRRRPHALPQAAERRRRLDRQADRRQGRLLHRRLREPNADPLETELRLMRRKVGGRRPLLRHPERLRREGAGALPGQGAAKFGLPVIVGVLPLHNSRHAEFLHKEVPGMNIPDAIRERMRRAGEERGPGEGQAMARDFLAFCREKCAGVYLVPSFGRYDLRASSSPKCKRPRPVAARWPAAAWPDQEHARSTSRPRPNRAHEIHWHEWGDEAFARGRRPRTSRSSLRSPPSGATGATSWTRPPTPTPASSPTSTSTSSPCASTTTSAPTSTPATTWAAGPPPPSSPRTARS